MQKMLEASVPPVRVAATLLAVASLTVMANATIAPALPGLRDTFAEVPYATTLVGLVMTLPSLFIVLTAAVSGMVADRIGRRPVMIAGLLLYGIAGASGAFVDGLPAMLIGRAFLGAGNGALMTSALAMIGDLYQGPARERFVGVQGATLASSGVLFMISGGLLAELGWRYPFLAYAAALALIPFVRVLLPETLPEKKVGGEGTKERLPVATLAVLGPIAFLAMVAFYLVPTQLPFRLLDVGVKSPSVAGLAIASNTLTMALVALSFARVRRVLSPFAIHTLVFVLMAAGYTVVGWSGSLAGTVAGAAIAGAGLGLFFPNNNSLLYARTPPSVRGRAAGIMTTCVFSGQFASPLVSGPIAERVGYGATFEIVAVGCVVVGLVTGLVALRDAR
jgi:MFS family permease